MAPLKPPQKLLDLLIGFVKTKIVILIKRADGQNGFELALTSFRDYLESWLPKEIASNLLEDIFKDQSLCTEMKFAALQILHFPDRSTRLVLEGSIRETHHTKLLTFLKLQCSNLEQLNLRGVWVDATKLSESIRRMPQLRHLTIPYIANPCLMEVISRKAAHLQTLDLSGSREINDDNLLLLTSLKTLQVINLAPQPEDSVSTETVGKLINGLPKLISLGSYPYTGKAIHHLADKLKRTQALGIRYVHDRRTPFEVLSSVQNLCPGLNSCFLNEPSKNLIRYLQPFKNLRKLKVSKVSAEEVLEMLQVIGHQLLHLELVCLRESLDLCQVSQYCGSNLQSLEIYYSMSVHVSSSLDFSFKSLKKLNIYCTEIRGSSPVANILLSCLDAEKITLCKCDALDDESLADILEKKALAKCQDLCLLEAPYLSMDSVRLILMSCNDIHVLGRLDSWGLTWSEVEELRYEIQLLNLDVKLWEYFSTLERQDAFEDDLEQFIVM